MSLTASSATGGFEKSLVLGGKLFEEGVESNGLVVVHRDADGAKRCAVGAEEGRHQSSRGQRTEDRRTGGG